MILDGGLLFWGPPCIYIYIYIYIKLKQQEYSNGNFLMTKNVWSIQEFTIIRRYYSHIASFHHFEGVAYYIIIKYAKQAYNINSHGKMKQKVSFEVLYAGPYSQLHSGY